MFLTRKSPTFVGLQPTTNQARAAARGSSKKTDTKCELTLRSCLWRAGYRFRKNVVGLPGRPDVVFVREQVAVFCDGDFWHGRNWEARSKKLAAGANPTYWVAKIEHNRERDRRNTEALEVAGWTVVRLWESEILSQPEQAARRVMSELERARGARDRD